MSDLLDEPFGVRLVSLKAMRHHYILQDYIGLNPDLYMRGYSAVKKFPFIYLKCYSKEEMDQIKWDIKHKYNSYYLVKPKKINCLHHQREYRPRKCKKRPRKM